MSTKRKRTGANAAVATKTSESDASNHKQARIAQKGSSSKDGHSSRRKRQDEAEANRDSSESESEDEDMDPRQENHATTTEEHKTLHSRSSTSSNGKGHRKSGSASKRSSIVATAAADAANSASLGNKTSASAYSYKINPPPEGRPVRVYCDGIYDLFHFGHAKALEQAKKAFPNVYLLVGVCDDVMTHSRKGKTVMTDKERYESLRHCKWVDEVVESAPWVVDQAFLDKHQIDYVAHDDIPYKSVEGDDVYAFVKNQGCFLPTNRTDGVSTSELITRIVKDYDQYLRRNLERGVTAKELGIGFFKEQEVKLKKSAQDIRASIRQNWHGTKDELKNEISVLRNDLRQTMNMWEDKSQEFVRDFSKLFGADSVVNKIFRRRRHGNGERLITDGNYSSPNSGASSRMASPSLDSRDGSDAEDFRSRSPSMDLEQGRRSMSSDFGDQSPRSESDE